MYLPLIPEKIKLIHSLLTCKDVYYLFITKVISIIKYRNQWTT